MTSKTITVDTNPIHYVILHPEKEHTILMVHGFRGNHIGLLQLAENLPDFRIIIPDLPGCGSTPPQTNGHHSVNGFAKLIRQFADALKLDDFTLLGHSYGALIAAHIAAESSRGINRLILMNPVSESSKFFAYLSRLYYRVGLALPNKLGYRLLYSRLVNRFMSFSMMKTRDPQLRKAIYAHHLTDLDYPYYRSVIAEEIDSVFNSHIFADVAKITLPTLIIAGELDDLAPLSSQHKLVRLIPQAKLEVIPGVGHLTHLEKVNQSGHSITMYLTDSSTTRHNLHHHAKAQSVAE